MSSSNRVIFALACLALISMANGWPIVNAKNQPKAVSNNNQHVAVKRSIEPVAEASAGIKLFNESFEVSAV